MKNYDYGKFINGVLERAPKVLIIGDTKIINPTEEHFIQAGYRKIVKTEMPVKEGYYYIGKMIDDNGVPTEFWEEHEITDKELE